MIAIWTSESVSSVTQSWTTLCDPMDFSTPSLPVHHQLPEFTQTHVHWVGDAIQSLHPLSKSLPLFRIQFSLVAQLCPTLCDPMDCSTPDFPVHHQLPESTQTHTHHVSDAIQPSHALLSPSPPAFNFSQHNGLFQWVNSSHQVAKVLEFQLQHQSFQRTLRTDFL